MDEVKMNLYRGKKCRDKKKREMAKGGELSDMSSV